MGFFEVLTKVVSNSAKNQAKERNKFARDYERKNPNMSSAERERLEKFNRVTEKMEDLGNKF